MCDLKGDDYIHLIETQPEDTFGKGYTFSEWGWLSSGDAKFPGSMLILILINVRSLSSWKFPFMHSSKFLFKGQGKLGHFSIQHFPSCFNEISQG